MGDKAVQEGSEGGKAGTNYGHVDFNGAVGGRGGGLANSRVKMKKRKLMRK